MLLLLLIGAASGDTPQPVETQDYHGDVYIYDDTPSTPVQEQAE